MIRGLEHIKDKSQSGLQSSCYLVSEFEIKQAQQPLKNKLITVYFTVSFSSLTFNGL